VSETTTGPVPVSPAVAAGLEAVRRGGLVNMMDRAAVAEIADGLGFAEAAAWVRANRHLYARLLFHGLQVNP
jgi:hypothetical protein